jgi:hypothetical protein
MGSDFVMVLGLGLGLWSRGGIRMRSWRGGMVSGWEGGGKHSLLDFLWLGFGWERKE